MKFFDKFGSKEKSSSNRTYTLYVRDIKPSAMQGWIFSDKNVESLPASLAEVCPAWLWESTRTGPPLVVSDETPEHRPRQEVTVATAAELMADLVEKNLNGFRRFVALYGGDQALLVLNTDEQLWQAVEAFASGEESPLSLLLVQMGDVAADVIYFNSDGAAGAELLFNKLSIPAISTIHKLPYKEMNGEDLETVASYLSCAEHDH